MIARLLQLSGGCPLERAPAWRDSELCCDLPHGLSDLVLLEPKMLILPPQVLEVPVQLFGLFLCRADALTRLVVGREQLGQEVQELTGLLDPLRDSLSRFSSGCGVHDHPSIAERSTGTYPASSRSPYHSSLAS